MYLNTKCFFLLFAEARKTKWRQRGRIQLVLGPAFPDVEARQRRRERVQSTNTGVAGRTILHEGTRYNRP